MFRCRMSSVALFVGLILAVACPDSVGGETLLRMKFTPGQKTHFVMTQEMQMKMTVKDVPNQMTSTSTMEYDWEVTAIDDQGVASITMSCARIRVKMQGPQGVMMEYDSQSDKKPEGMAAMMTSVFENMVGKPYAMKMDRQGHVLEIKPPQGLAESMSKLPGGASIGSMFSEEGMKKTAEFTTFPEEPVKSGDTWVRSTTMKNPAIGDMTIDVTFRYVGPEVRDGRELEKIRSGRRDPPFPSAWNPSSRSQTAEHLDRCWWYAADY